MDDDLRQGPDQLIDVAVLAGLAVDVEPDAAFGNVPGNVGGGKGGWGMTKAKAGSPGRG